MTGLRIFFLSCAFAFLLGGCESSDTPPPVVPETPVVSDDFALVAADGEGRQDRPSLTLRFNRSLAQAQNFDKLLSVRDGDGKEVDGSWVLDNDGTVLRFPYVTAEQRYSVVLEPGLVATDGETLDQRIDREIEAVSIPPAVGFASEGSVLPARGTDGLPVLAVNVAEVDVEFFRVRDDRLNRFFAEYSRQGRRWEWDLREIRELADPVYMNRFSLSEDRNQRGVHHLPVHELSELERPGVYFAVMKASGSFEGEYQTTHYFRSDIGLHTRQYRDQLLVHSASLASGKPLSDVNLAIIDRQGRTIVEARTNGQGVANLSYQHKRDHVLVARSGSDASVLYFGQPALDLSEFDVDGPPADDLSVFIWSSRDLYRPGESLRFFALARDYDGRALSAAPPLYATLRQPDGRAHARQQLKPDPSGSYEWQRAVSADVPTGRWSLELSLTPDGNAKAHRYPFRVEEFLPERLKLVLDSDAARLTPGQTLPLQIEADYLYGAPAAGNRFTASVQLAAARSPFADAPGFLAGDLIEGPKGEINELLDIRLGQDGTASADLEVPAEGLSAPVDVRVVGRVFETGGRAVSRALSRVLWPNDRWLALHPRFEEQRADRRAVFDLRRLNSEGKTLPPVSTEVRLIREERDYHWRYDDDLGWQADFTQRFVEQERRQLEIGGEAAIEVAFDLDWGNYRVEMSDPESGALTRYAFVAGWGFDDPNQGLDARPDKVKLALDQTRYRAGDQVKLTITSPHDGPALLLVESDHLLAMEQLQVNGPTEHTLTIPAEWERHDVYMTALVFRPGSAVERITPKRAVGIVHLPFDRADRAVEVELTAPTQMQPGMPLEVQVNAPALAGQQAWVRVVAVDQGILNITRFALPDAFAALFAKRRYGVEAIDLYGRVIEALAGQRARLRYGGDAALITSLPQARRPTAKVLTVDLASEPVALDAQGRATVQLAVPDFNGALRVSALVYSGDHYGAAASETKVRAPITVEASSPRVMAPGDSARLTVDVDNGTGSDQRFALSVRTEGPLSVERESAAVEVAKDRRETLSFPLRATAGVGVGRVIVSASGGGEQVEHEFELVVRPGWPNDRESRFEVLPVGEAYRASGVPANWFADSVNARITMTPRLPVPALSAIKYLQEYTYGCVEQTTSKAYAYLLASPEVVERLGLPEISAQKRQRNVQYAIDRIGSLQLASGHFAFWSSGDYYDPLITPYVTEFLLDARDAGFNVPPELLQKSLEKLKAELLSGGAVAWSRYYGDRANHARLAFNGHAALVLARVDQAPLGTLRNIYEKQGDKALGGLPLTRLGLALIRAGDESNGRAAIARSFDGKLWPAAANGVYGYGLPVGQQAEQLALTLAAGQLPSRHNDKLLSVARDSHAQRWLSTHDQVALIKLAVAGSADQAKHFDVRISGADLDLHLVEKDAVSRDLSAAQLRAGVRFAPESDAQMYVVDERVGTATRAPEEVIEGLSISRSYFDLKGKPWSGGRLREGDGLAVLLSVRAQSDVPDAIVVDLLPGGLELENPGLMDSTQQSELVIAGESISDRLSYRPVQFEEFRDDRYVAALNLNNGNSVELVYLVRAVSPGEFLVPPPQAEDMYRPQIRAIGKSPLTSITVESVQ
ncbi:MAG: alpha-2-macroglobulin family protein [Xanthomonadales bacterium]|nr:alpha-2-macroglobulin family protein [Xanthomonadales bacterium]